MNKKQRLQSRYVQIAIAVTVLVLSLGLVFLTRIIRERSTTPTQSKAGSCSMRFYVGTPGGAAEITRVVISPGSLEGLQANGKPIPLSVSVFDALGREVTDSSVLQWGISTTGSVGTIQPDAYMSGELATFTPAQAGQGDIFVTATSEGKQITASIPVSVNAYPIVLESTDSIFGVSQISTLPNTSRRLFVTPRMASTGESLPSNHESSYEYEVESGHAGIISNIGTSVPVTTLPGSSGFYKQIDFDAVGFGTTYLTVRLKERDTQTVVASARFYKTFIPSGAFPWTAQLPPPQPTATPEATPGSGEFRVKVRVDNVTASQESIQGMVEIGLVGQAAPLYSGLGTFTRSEGSSFETTITPPFSVFSGQQMWVSVKGEKHLRRVSAPTALSQEMTVDLSSTALVPGDLPQQDGDADLDDLNMMLTILAKSTKTDEEVFSADLNYDGVINAFDIRMMLGTLSFRPDEGTP